MLSQPRRAADYIKYDLIAPKSLGSKQKSGITKLTLPIGLPLHILMRLIQTEETRSKQQVKTVMTRNQACGARIAVQFPAESSGMTHPANQIRRAIPAPRGRNGWRVDVAEIEKHEYEITCFWNLLEYSWIGAAFLVGVISRCKQRYRWLGMPWLLGTLPYNGLPPS